MFRNALYVQSRPADAVLATGGLDPRQRALGPRLSRLLTAGGGLGSARCTLAA